MAKGITRGASQRPLRQRGVEDEAGRLATVRRYAILDTPEEPAFDRIAVLARQILQVPTAVVSVIDESRQWFKARVGLRVWETPRDWSFCDHAIRERSGTVFVVPDASQDPRFAANPLVTGPPRIRFYAGAPIRARDGHGLGAVAVISPQPRPEGLSQAQRTTLRALAEVAADELELRLQTRLAEEAARGADAARLAEAHLRRAQLAAGVVAFEIGAAGAATGGAALREMHGLPPEGRTDLASFLAAIHPEDRPGCEAERERLIREGGVFEHAYRVPLPGGAVRWVELRGKMLGAGRRTWRAVGVAQDVSARQELEEQQALLAREVDHRAKNTLAVVQAALRLTPREDPASFAQAVEGRIGALARTHALLAKERWSQAGLRALIETELQPFLHRQRRIGPLDAAPGPVAVLQGPPLSLGPDAAQPMAMAIHELATNATKYGALSLPGGRLQVTWSVDPERRELVLRWVERGGPPVLALPTRRGFGTRVLETTVRAQLAGSLEVHWARDGLNCTIRAPVARVLAGGDWPLAPR